jgi:hypothetical protein
LQKVVTLLEGGGGGGVKQLLEFGFHPTKTKTLPQMAHMPNLEAQQKSFGSASICNPVTL